MDAERGLMEYSVPSPMAEVRAPKVVACRGDMNLRGTGRARVLAI